MKKLVDNIENNIDTMKDEFLRKIKSEIDKNNKLLKQKSEQLKNQFDIDLFPGDWIYLIESGRVKRAQVKTILITLTGVVIHSPQEEIIKQPYFKEKEDAMIYYNNLLDCKKLKF